MKLAPAVRVESSKRVPTLAALPAPRRLSRPDYSARLKTLQLEVLRLQRRVVEEGLRILLIFEGVDAAGKGGAIRRLTQHLDPRWVRVHSLSRPSSQDQSYHYLRRYLIRVPRRGRITIYDDYSWYGRMLVEPIEGLISAEEYERAPRARSARWSASSPTAATSS